LEVVAWSGFLCFLLILNIFNINYKKGKNRFEVEKYYLQERVKEEKTSLAISIFSFASTERFGVEQRLLIFLCGRIIFCLKDCQNLSRQ